MMLSGFVCTLILLKVSKIHHKITLKCVTATSVGQEVGQSQWRAPSRGYNSASGDSFHMKLTQDIKQKLGKTMKNII